MKNIIRTVAFASVFPVVFVGLSTIHTKAGADPTNVAMIHAGTVPGPMPTCNPMTQACPNVRSK